MITGLEDKVVLVTGGAGGIGEAICRAFSSEGSQVIVHYHNSFDNAQKISQEINGYPINADLTIKSETESMFEDIISKFGQIDVCIANAGYYPPEQLPLWKIDPERWKETLSLNLDASFNTARSFLEHAVSNK